MGVRPVGSFLGKELWNDDLTVGCDNGSFAVFCHGQCCSGNALLKRSDLRSYNLSYHTLANGLCRFCFAGTAWLRFHTQKYDLCASATVILILPIPAEK